MDIENLDMKLGLAVVKERSTVGINNGNIENVNRQRIVMYLKGQLLYTCLLCSMFICSHPRIYNVRKEK